jgi:hypothetical protein
MIRLDKRTNTDKILLQTRDEKYLLQKHLSNFTVRIQHRTSLTGTLGIDQSASNSDSSPVIWMVHALSTAHLFDGDIPVAKAQWLESPRTGRAQHERATIIMMANSRRLKKLASLKTEVNALTTSTINAQARPLASDESTSSP